MTEGVASPMWFQTTEAGEGWEKWVASPAPMLKESQRSTAWSVTDTLSWAPLAVLEMEASPCRTERP